MTLGPGDAVAGRYELIRMLGGGEGGRVYVAYDRHLAREVALRFVEGDAAAADTLLAEGRRMSALGADSPQAVAVLDAGPIDGGGAYTATELVDGTPLDEVARRRAPLAPAAATSIAVQLLDACLAVQRHQGGRADTVVASALEAPDGRIRVTRFEQAAPGPAGADPACADVARTLETLMVGANVPAHLRRTIDDATAGRIRGADDMRARLVAGPSAYEHETVVLPPPPPAEPPGRKRWPWIVAAIVAALVIAGVAAWLVTRDDGETATIPDVAGRTAAEAVSALRDAGFTTRTAGRTDSSVPRGIVISTSPAAGDEAEVGSEVTVNVSQGTGTTTVPTLAGLSRDDAVAALTDAGLESRIVEEESTSVAAGTVIQQDPSAGVQVPVGTTVAVTVSTGPPMTEVPDLQGRTLEDASRLLQRADLDLGTVQEVPAGGADPGTVVTQDPSAGEDVPEGTSVDVTVAADGGTGTTGG